MAKTLRQILFELNVQSWDNHTPSEASAAAEVYFPISNITSVGDGGDTPAWFPNPLDELSDPPDLPKTKIKALTKYAGHKTEGENHYEISPLFTSKTKRYERGDTLERILAQEHFASESQILLKQETIDNSLILNNQEEKMNWSQMCNQKRHKMNQKR